MTHWIRFEHAGQPGFGTLDGTTIHVHTGDMFATPTPNGTTLDLATTPLLAPVRPANFIGLWNNFHAVATALNLGIPDFPLFFL